MSRFLYLQIALCCLCSIDARAGVISLTLHADRDLTSLQVGDRITIDVVLDKRSVGNLFWLGATVQLRPGLLSDPNNVAVGPIVADPADFFSTAITQDPFDLSSPVVALDGLFLASLDSISTNGSFFTFDFMAQTPGHGAIEFDYFSLEAYDESLAGYFEDDFDTNRLPFNITGNSTVPEPGSLACFVILGVLGWSVGRRDPSDDTG